MNKQESIETLEEALKKRKIECRVETSEMVYCGLPKDLLIEIPEKEEY